MGATEHRIGNYAEFWLWYLREHARPQTRIWHVWGTLLGVGFIATFVVTFNPWHLASAFLAGYGPAWMAHILVEKNRPATWRYPLWSLLSDFRMTAAWLTGRLSNDLERAGIPQNRTVH